ncbi:MAG: hypothetical protein NXI31_21845 [bacterium]|nr:hypothetical protein [bacterium]
MTRDRNPERGGALIMVLVLVVVIGSLTNSLFHNGRRLTTATIGERDTLAALQAAEGGIAQAQWQLRNDPDYGGETLTIGGAEVTISAHRVASTAERWQVRSHARLTRSANSSTRAQRCVNVTLLRGAPAGVPRIVDWHERR